MSSFSFSATWDARAASKHQTRALFALYGTLNENTLYARSEGGRMNADTLYVLGPSRRASSAYLLLLCVSRTCSAWLLRIRARGSLSSVYLLASILSPGGQHPWPRERKEGALFHRQYVGLSDALNEETDRSPLLSWPQTPGSRHARRSDQHRSIRASENSLSVTVASRLVQICRCHPSRNRAFLDGVFSCDALFYDLQGP